MTAGEVAFILTVMIVLIGVVIYIINSRFDD
jgi:hypothetical protein